MINRSEIIKWFFVITILIFTVVGNYYYHDIFFPLRALIITILVGISLGIILITTQGKIVLNFLLESRNEMRKVIWPSRQETIHATLIVIVVTTIMSIIVWGLDRILIRLVSLITSLRF